MDKKERETARPQVNPGYAVFQIARALTTSEQHEDPETRQRAQERIAKWTSVLNGILSGKLDVGSRTPLEGVPGWATLEVLTGGFATGRLLASGPLLDHERDLLAGLTSIAETDERRALNRYYLTDEGLADLRERLRSGMYDVAVPEEGALLVVAWLVGNGNAEEARALLEELAPHFPTMRFYPIPTKRARLFGSRVFLQDVGRTIDDLRRIGPKHQILAQKEAIEIWAPLYDRVVQLFVETVEDELPTLQKDSNGKPIVNHDGRFEVQGGWPCRKYPDGWGARAQEALDDYDRMRSEHKLCGRPDRAKDSFAQLRKYLLPCISSPESLTGREVGRIRLILARYINKRGTPDSVTCSAIRRKQAQQSSAPTFHRITQAVIPRLDLYPKDDGLDDLQVAVQPITGDEGELWNVPAGTAVPWSVHRKIHRSLTETVDVLVERGIITSGETLARVLPQMTSGLQSAGITDPSLRRLYATIYRAFRRRRSLLLLNLESQIRIEELPWVAAIDRFRRNDLSARELAKQALEEVATLTIASFPHAILPNKLLQELRGLTKTADLNLPLVDEVAADIFMGEFTGKFLQAAKKAARLLEGTLYENYYGIDYGQLRSIPEFEPAKNKRWFRRKTRDQFVQLCSRMAGTTYGGWDPAINGMIIEQQQILTTQNLAVLFDGLNLTEVLRDRLDELARRCFAWVCRRQQVKASKRHAQLIMLKNTAYAWRQMVFFLSLLPSDSVQAFVAWASEHLGKQSDEFQVRFRPAFLGLTIAAEGCSLDESARQLGARRFLGWSKEKHWLLD